MPLQRKHIECDIFFSLDIRITHVLNTLCISQTHQNHTPHAISEQPKHAKTRPDLETRGFYPQPGVVMIKVTRPEVYIKTRQFCRVELRKVCIYKSHGTSRLVEEVETSFKQMLEIFKF